MKALLFIVRASEPLKILSGCRTEGPDRPGDANVAQPGVLHSWCFDA